MLLTILKIILYIILILLLVILLLLAVLLLSGLKYSIKGGYNETAKLFVHASWLFGLVKADYRYGSDNDGFELTLPFGLGKKKDEAETAEGSPKEPSQESPPEDISEPAEQVTEETDAPQDDIPESISDDDDITESFGEDEYDEYDIFSDDAPFAEEKPEKKQKNKRAQEQKPKEDGIVEKAKKLYADFNSFKEKYDIKLLLKIAFNCITGLIKALGIKKGSISGILGFSDPSQTGMAMGGISIARIYLPIDININGDFEKQHIALDGSIDGKTCLLRLVMPILIFIFKKPVRTMIADYFRGKSDKKRRHRRKRRKNAGTNKKGRIQ